MSLCPHLDIASQDFSDTDYNISRDEEIEMHPQSFSDIERKDFGSVNALDQPATKQIPHNLLSIVLQIFVIVRVFKRTSRNIKLK